MERNNCWEVKDCGRQLGGQNVDELGVCPAAEAVQYDGINGGKNGGRLCWAIAGTFCRGQVQGTFAAKSEGCFKCEFFQQVCQDEERDFVVFPKNSSPQQ